MGYSLISTLSSRIPLTYPSSVTVLLKQSVCVIFENAVGFINTA